MIAGTAEGDYRVGHDRSAGALRTPSRIRAFRGDGRTGWRGVHQLQRFCAGWRVVSRRGAASIGAAALTWSL